MWKLENTPNEMGDLVKEISRQILKVPPGFFLLLVKWNRRGKC